jgi:hypothetical protein
MADFWWNFWVGANCWAKPHDVERSLCAQGILDRHALRQLTQAVRKTYRRPHQAQAGAGPKPELLTKGRS